ncbi:hypothetical protein [Sporosarcina highlanderae]|uniref:Uncharacterized protein n=1 Tax=Sporosarcina highlanderae TaxID=3035916 RepID=A0ABT8JXS1_9BACL|nr:hypothetical protein [Sporosarcina highlanderae]MDN4609152.1 hypothetical protein [Sporosarcina highlanderae]
MKLGEVFADAIQYDEPRLAYSIYWATQNGHNSSQSYETLKTIEIDWVAVDGLIKSNPLNISAIRLYSYKEGDGFHFVLAKSVREAKIELLNELGWVPEPVHDVSHGMDKFLWRNGEMVYIRKIKDTSLKFPLYLGWYARGDID